MKRQHAGECPICLNVMEMAVYIECGHFFCEACIDKCDKCPVCRKTKLLKTTDKTNLFVKTLTDSSVESLCCASCKNLYLDPFLITDKNSNKAFICQMCINNVQDMEHFQLARTAEPAFFNYCFDDIETGCPNNCGWFGKLDAHSYHIQFKCDYQAKHCFVCKNFIIQKEFNNHLSTCVLEMKEFQPQLVKQMLVTQNVDLGYNMELHLCTLIVNFILNDIHAVSFMEELKYCVQKLSNCEEYVSEVIERRLFFDRFLLSYDHNMQISKFWQVIKPLLHKSDKILSLLTLDYAIYGMKTGNLKLHVIKPRGGDGFLTMKVPSCCQEIQQCLAAYKSQHMNRKLLLFAFAGEAEVDIQFLNGIQSIRCSSVQMSILLQLDESNITLKLLIARVFENKSLRELDLSNFYSHLLGLVHPKFNLVLKSSFSQECHFDDILCLNLNYKSIHEIISVPIVKYTLESKKSDKEQHFLDTCMCCLLMSRSGIKLGAFYSEMIFQNGASYHARFTKKLEIQTLKETLRSFVERNYAEIKENCVFYVR